MNQWKMNPQETHSQSARALQAPWPHLSLTAYHSTPFFTNQFLSQVIDFVLDLAVKVTYFKLT
jgi:hypothetical protein